MNHPTVFSSAIKREWLSILGFIISQLPINNFDEQSEHTDNNCQNYNACYNAASISMLKAGRN